MLCCPATIPRDEAPPADGGVAVGHYILGNGNGRTLGECWNGSAWTERAMPHPARLNSAVLNGVSCVSASDCTAVGQYRQGTITQVALAA